MSIDELCQKKGGHDLVPKESNHINWHPYDAIPRPAHHQDLLLSLAK
jgi:hypothetical protein